MELDIHLSQLTQTVLATLIGYLASVVTTAFIIGMRWGKLERDVEYLKQQLAEIKGMFKLTLRKDDD